MGEGGTVSVEEGEGEKWARIGPTKVGRGKNLLLTGSCTLPTTSCLSPSSAGGGRGGDVLVYKKKFLVPSP